MKNFVLEVKEELEFLNSINDEDIKLLDFHLSQHESKTVEFKEKTPDTVRKLAENIASFATSNQGTIYIGINKSGDIIGIKGIDTPEEKENFQRRIFGIVSMVKPAIRVDMKFMTRNSCNIVKISVPKGSEPVYYVDDIPYLRDLSSSRRATTNEVKELHQKYFEGLKIIFPSEDKQQEFLRDTLNCLSDTNLALFDIEDHLSNPNLNQLKYDLGINGKLLLELSSDVNARKLKLDEKLKELAEKLKDMESYQFYLGKEYYDRFLDNGRHISKGLEPLTRQIRDIISINYSKAEFKVLIEAAVVNLKNNWEIGRKYNIAKSDLETLRDSFRISGYEFHRLAFLPVEDCEYSE